MLAINFIPKYNWVDQLKLYIMNTLVGLLKISLRLQWLALTRLSRYWVHTFVALMGGSPRYLCCDAMSFSTFSHFSGNYKYFTPCDFLCNHSQFTIEEQNRSMLRYKIWREWYSFSHNQLLKSEFAWNLASFLYWTLLKILLFLRNFVVFEFTFLLPRTCFSVFGLEPSKNLSLKLARCMTVTHLAFGHW